MSHAVNETITQLAYLVAAGLFVFSLRWLNRPRTARRGVGAGVAGMALAIFGTLLHPEIIGYGPIVVAALVGTAVGVPLSRVPLTAVPQRTAISHAFGGLAAGLVGVAKYSIWLEEEQLTAFKTFAIVVEVILGFLTFTGSLMAAGQAPGGDPDAADHLPRTDLWAIDQSSFLAARVRFGFAAGSAASTAGVSVSAAGVSAFAAGSAATALAAARRSLDDLASYARPRGIKLGIESRVNHWQIPTLDELGSLLALLRKHEVTTYKEGDLLIQLQPSLPAFGEPEVADSVVAGGWKRGAGLAE